MPPTFPFTDIEKKWQARWDEARAFSAPVPSADTPPYFILVMFPYPSGRLHMGHVRNYTIGDVLARYHRRLGRAVLHPIGWDAFGLPAENAAIERKTNPARWTWENIAFMRGQLKMLGISYDWEREFATCDPAYYRWNQWLFVKMFEKGLAYRKTSPVNWCPHDQTVLANEQAQDGRCWRCGTAVIQRDLEQWFFRITAYARELLDGHDLLRRAEPGRGWPEQVLAMQRNWIGASDGATVEFTAVDPATPVPPIRVFTTRADTLFGATFLVLAPEHPAVDAVTTADARAAVTAYREAARQLSRADRTAAERPKSGVFTGGVAVNPVDGRKVPIWIADYVLTDYGTGAIMAVPAHDERDFAFARRFDLPVIEVIRPSDDAGAAAGTLETAYTGEGVLANSGAYTGVDSVTARSRITADLAAKGVGAAAVTYKLRDWLLSRQRYWGTPIPIIYCDACGAVPVPEADLPVTLPEDVTFTGTGASPLAQNAAFLNAPCPRCGGPGRRETDTMDTFVDSSWYYLRYTDAKNNAHPFDRATADAWVPVHQYVGGIEHACMHLIYSRFFHKVMRDMGMITPPEPFANLLTQGMVTLGGSAMSKSRGNVVDPDQVVSRFGADTCRLFILFAAPPTQQLEWSETQVEGVWRFLNRVWRLVDAHAVGGDARAPKRTPPASSAAGMVDAEALRRLSHQTIQRVTEDIDRDFGFNTAIAAVMELVNAIYLYPDLGDAVSKGAVETAVGLLSPFAPHVAEEMWERLGHDMPLERTPWPVADPALLRAKSADIVVQVNGKVRERITAPSGASQEAVETAALAALAKKGHAITSLRVIFVPDKLINFVVGKAA